jgi:hypothetical protein
MLPVSDLYAEVKAVWQGSWEHQGNLENRLGLRLSLPVLTLRAEAADRRLPQRDVGFQLAGFGEGKGLTSFSGGLYHNPTGSRLLWGLLDEWGLPARLRNPWLRGLPFAENHKPTMADLKTGISASKKAEGCLYLGSPVFELPGLSTSIRGFAQAQINTDLENGMGGGLDFRFGKNALLLESFFAGGTLAPVKSGSWFSEKPPLPGRDYRLHAGGFLWTSPVLALSSDWAWSDTWAFGKDLYGNLGIRIGNFLPFAGGSWHISLAADGAGNRFIGRDGSNPGKGFRSGGKFEWKGRRGSLFRLTTTLYAPALGEDFNRSSSSLYFRFPSPGTRPALRLTRFSLSASRDGRDASKVLDDAELTLAFSLRLSRKAGGLPPLGISLTGKAAGIASRESRLAYPLSAAHAFDSAQARGELSWSPAGNFFGFPGALQLRAGAGYTVRNGKAPFWNASFSAALRFKYGRLGLKIAASEISDQKPFANSGIWDYTLSWRLEH